MNEAGLPIVLVPGLSCSARLYAEQVPALWRFGPVMVADHTRDNTVDEIAARILAHAPPAFALAGLSMGGYIALAIMRQAPHRVARLALLDTSARPDTPEQSERRRAQIALAEAGRFDEVLPLLWPLFVHPDRQRDEELRAVVRAMAHDTGTETFIRQQRALIARPDARPTLARIQCPTLVLVGDGDQLTPPFLAEELAAGIKHSEFVTIPDCGHLSTMERPQAVNRALSTWLSR